MVKDNFVTDLETAKTVENTDVNTCNDESGRDATHDHIEAEQTANPQVEKGQIIEKVGVLVRDIVGEASPSKQKRRRGRTTIPKSQSKSQVDEDGFTKVVSRKSTKLALKPALLKHLK